MELKQNRLGGAAALLGAALIYASFGVLIRLMTAMYGDYAQVAARFLTAFALLSLYMLIRQGLHRISRRDFIKVACLGIAFVMAALLFTISVNQTKLANSVFMLYAGSITSAFIIGTFRFREKVTHYKFLAITLALIGLYMYSGAILSFSVGILTALAAGGFDGIANSLRKSLGGLNRNLALFYQYAVGTLAAIIFTLAAGGTIIKTITLGSIITTIIYACLLIFLGNLLLYGFHNFSVNTGTVILTMELVFIIAIGYAFYAEQPSPQELLGGGFIFAASILSTVEKKKPLPKGKQIA